MQTYPRPAKAAIYVRCRQRLRTSGLRLLRVWVPDTRSPQFAEECRRQSLLVACAEREERAEHDWLDAALADVDGWHP